MNKDLATNILSIVDNYIEEYILTISEKYNIDQRILKNDWKTLKKISNKKSNTTSSKEQSMGTIASEAGSRAPKGRSRAGELISQPSKTRLRVPIPNRCPYIFTKGKKKGEFCGSKPRKGGGPNCSKHKKYENTKFDSKKSVPPLRTSTINSDNERKSKMIERKLVRSPFKGYYLHRPTKLILKNKVVVGVFDESLSKQFIDILGQNNIDDAKRYSFKFDTTHFLKKVSKYDFNKSLREEISKSTEQDEPVLESLSPLKTSDQATKLSPATERSSVASKARKLVDELCSSSSADSSSGDKVSDEEKAKKLKKSLDFAIASTSEMVHTNELTMGDGKAKFETNFYTHDQDINKILKEIQEDPDNNKEEDYLSLSDGSLSEQEDDESNSLVPICHK